MMRFLKIVVPGFLVGMSFLMYGKEPMESYFKEGFPEKVDFLSSMGWYDPANKGTLKKKFWGNGSRAPESFARVYALKNLYEKNDFLKKEQQGAARIPKIIHQIWVGPNQPPAIFKESQETIKKYHPDWEYKLWTDADLPAFNLHNQKYYDSSTNYGEKADIWRYEILYRYGGVYLDIDYICLKPFDILAQYDLWASILPLKMRATIANGIIGAVPGNPLLWDCIETLKDDWNAFDREKASAKILGRAGPRHFQKSFMKFIDDPSLQIIAFPTNYFYPVPFVKRGAALDNENNERQKEFDKAIAPESFAVHCWAGSWWPHKGKKSKATVSLQSLLTPTPA